MIPVIVISSESTDESLMYCQRAWRRAWANQGLCMQFFVFSDVFHERWPEYPNWHPIDIPKGAPFGHAVLAGQEQVYRNFGKGHPYMIWLDDYILRDINVERFFTAWGMISAMDHVRQMRLLPCPGPTLYFPTLEDGPIGVVQGNDRYSISFQAAFWRDIHEFVEENWSPWQCEINGSAKAARMESLSHTTGQFLASRTNIVSYENLFRRGKMKNDAFMNVKRMGL